MYAVIKILKDLGYVKRVLVVAPLKVAHNVWPVQKNEWEQFKDLTVSVLHGPKKEELLHDDSLIHVINPEGLNWLLEARWSGKNASKKGGVQVSEERLAFVKANYDMLVVDESTKFKHTTTNRFAVLRKFISVFKRRYILTGTISPNGLHDLFGQIYILDEGSSLGQYITHFRNKYFTPDPRIKGVWHPAENAAERVAEKIAPLVLRMRREDWLQMPELIFDDRYVTLPPEALHQYRLMEKELITMVSDKTIVAANTAVASGKCRQIANGALYVNGAQREHVVLHTAKLDELENLIDEMQGQSLLIPYVWQFDREMIQERLKIPCIGQGSEAKDAVLINQFNSGLCPNLLGHPETISLGLNLQGNCYHIAWYGLPWNLEHYLQTIDRIYRQGQKSFRVVVHRILAKDTLDEKMPLVLGKKGADMNDFMSLLQNLRQ